MPQSAARTCSDRIFRSWWHAAMAAALFAVATCATARTTRIDAAELMVGAKPTDVIDNTAFMPARHAAPAHQAFRGTLHLAEVEMTTHPADLHAHQVLGKDAQYFPGLALDFIAVDGDLVPATEEVIRAGSLGVAAATGISLFSQGEYGLRPLIKAGRGRLSRSHWYIRSRGRPTTGLRRFCIGGIRFPTCDSRSCSRRPRATSRPTSRRPA